MMAQGFPFHILFLIKFFVCSRETGALNRIIDRGSRAINFILSAMVFNVVPTVLEVIFSSSFNSVTRSGIINSLFQYRLLNLISILVFRYMFISFNIGVQISMVSGILAYKFGASFALITSLSVAAYVAFTLTITQVCHSLWYFLSKRVFDMLRFHYLRILIIWIM